MSTSHAVSGSTNAIAEQRPIAVADGRGALGRWRGRPIGRRHSAVLSDRQRRMLVRWLRRTAEQSFDPHPFRRRREVLLPDRIPAVRADLLEIAALLEHAKDPDPACAITLPNGCDSLPYSAGIHISELHTTLDHVRSEFTTYVSSPMADSPPSPTTATARPHRQRRALCTCHERPRKVAQAPRTGRHRPRAHQFTAV